MTAPETERAVRDYLTELASLATPAVSARWIVARVEADVRKGIAAEILAMPHDAIDFTITKRFTCHQYGKTAAIIDVVRDAAARIARGGASDG